MSGGGASSSAASTKTYPYIYAPDGWDTGWKAAKAAAGSAPLGITYIGDSIIQGVHSSNMMTKSAPALVRAALGAIYGNYADFYAGAMEQAYVNDPNVPFFFQAGRAQVGTSAFGPWALATDTLPFGTTGNFQYTTPYPCTALDIISSDLGAGTYQYNIDNAGGTGLVTATAPGAATATPWRVPITGLANTAHTLRFGNSSGGGGGFCNASGVLSYTGQARGLVHVMLGYNFSITGLSWNTPAVFESLRGGFRTGPGDNTYRTTFGWPAGSQLVVIGLGVNDMQNQYAESVYFHVIRRMIQSVRRCSPGCSVVLWASPAPDSDESDQTQLYANSKYWSTFIAIQRQLADAYSCALINTNAKWGENPVGRGFMDTTNTHPNDAGYADMASDLLSIL